MTTLQAIPSRQQGSRCFGPANASTLGRETTRRRWNLRRIFHPTDFSAASDVAFVHALKIAQATGAGLTFFHSEAKKTPPVWDDFPQVRATLARWRDRLGESGRSQDKQPGFHVEKVQTVGGRPLHHIVRHLRETPADLMVLATHQRHGLARWVSHPVAEPLVAHQAAMMTLVIPPNSERFVASHTGAVKRNRSRATPI